MSVKRVIEVIVCDGCNEPERDMVLVSKDGHLHLGLKCLTRILNQVTSDASQKMAGRPICHFCESEYQGASQFSYTYLLQENAETCICIKCLIWAARNVNMQVGGLEVLFRDDQMYRQPIGSMEFS